MKAFYAKFKCRLCGKTFIAVEADCRNTALKTAIEAVMGNSTMPQAPLVVDIHNCEGGNIGIADFIGFIQKENDSEVGE